MRSQLPVAGPQGIRQARPGDRLAFGDMALYTMVRNTAFNGIHQPAICTFEPDTGEVAVVRRSEYNDFRGRLS